MSTSPDVPMMRLVAGQEELEVVVHRRTYPSAQDWWDGNRLDATVSVTGGVFAGSYDTALRTDDFVDFDAGLAELADGVGSRARLSTVEQGLDLVVERTSHGTFAATFTARAAPEMGPSLACRFDAIEPAVVRAIREQVAGVLAQFPPRSKPDDDAIPPSWNEPLGPAEDPAMLRRHVRRHGRRTDTCPFCADVGDTVVALVRMDAHGDPGNPIEVGEHGVVTQIEHAEGGLFRSRRWGADEVSVMFGDEDRWTMCGPQHILFVQGRRHD